MEQILQGISSLLNDMLGGNGTYGITTVAQTDKKYRYVRMNEDSVITNLVDDTGTDVLATYNLGTTTWGAGTIIKLANGSRIKEITLSSGSAQGVI